MKANIVIKVIYNVRFDIHNLYILLLKYYHRLEAVPTEKRWITTITVLRDC